MTRYGAVWVEVAREQYLAMGPPAREQVDTAVEVLLEAPERPPSAYDPKSDQWTAVYGDGAGLIAYAVVRERRRIIVLRLV